MALRGVTGALLLDAHGTLLELQPPAPALQRVLRERCGIELTLEQAQRAIAAEVAYYRAHLHEGYDDAAVDELRGRCSQALREALAGERVLDALGADELTEVLLEALQFRPYPEVPEVLAELRRRGIATVVASNWDASLPRTLAKLGLRDQLDGVVTSAQCRVPKPNPEVFRAALGLVRASPEDAIHVGDSLEEDVTGARAAGIEPVLIGRDGRPAPDGVRTVRSLRELLDFPELHGGPAA